MNGDFEASSSMSWGPTAFGYHLAGLFAQEESSREAELRREKRPKKRAPIAPELHHSAVYQAVEQAPSDSPSKHFLTRALNLSRRVMDEGGFPPRGHRLSTGPCTGLERALCDLREELTFNGAVQYRVFVTGRPTPLTPELQQQIYFIAQEAVTNSLRHSQATTIEAEIHYLRRRLRILLRDNGHGIDPQVLGSGRTFHRGLSGMRQRAECVGAELKVWSRPGAGTEIEISVPIDRC